MFTLGFTEIFTILMVVIIVIKPEELPRFIRKIGRFKEEIKKTYEDVTKIKDDFTKLTYLDDKENKEIETHKISLDKKER